MSHVPLVSWASWEVVPWECDIPDLGVLGEVLCLSYVKVRVLFWPAWAFLSFLLAAPDSLVLAVGSCCSVVSSSAVLLVIAPCTLRPDYSAVCNVSRLLSLGLLGVPAPWYMNWPWWLVSRQNIKRKIKPWMDNQHIAMWRGPIST
jgi:hypothetical protein